MESAATHLTLTFISFCCMQIQSFNLIPSLKALNDAAYLYIVDLCIELDGFGSLASYDGTYIMAVDADDAITDFLPLKHLLFLYKNLSDDGKTLPVILCIQSEVPYRL